MKSSEYLTTCKLSNTGLAQEAVEITYSATFESQNTSIIKITNSTSKHTFTEVFKCQINFCECVRLITIFKENCIYPTHCKDIACDLGYKTVIITA